jgi:hypothetical protein
MLNKKNIIKSVSMAFLAIVLTSCGDESFRVVPTEQSVEGAGSVLMPPKLNLIIAMDDTGSMAESYERVRAEIQTFLGTLDQQKWDFRYVMIPLTQRRPVHHIVGSRFDRNHPLWTQRYPGDDGQELSSLPASVFQTADHYTDSLTRDDISTHATGHEFAFDHFEKMMKGELTASQFFDEREDALNVVIFVSTGDDTSGVNYCTRTDGIQIPCEDLRRLPCIPTEADPVRGGRIDCSSDQTSLNYYQTVFSSIRPRGMKIYTITPTDLTRMSASMCRGVVHRSSRYPQLAVSSGGTSFNLCAPHDSSVISHALTEIATHLQSQKQAYEIDYVMIAPDQEPRKVIVFRGGDASKREVIPQDAANGWTFESTVHDIYTMHLVSPAGRVIFLNKASGSAIHFHGSAHVVGTDLMSIDVTPRGAHDARTH